MSIWHGRSSPLSRRALVDALLGRKKNLTKRAVPRLGFARRCVEEVETVHLMNWSQTLQEKSSRGLQTWSSANNTARFGCTSNKSTILASKRWTRNLRRVLIQRRAALRITANKTCLCGAIRSLRQLEHTSDTSGTPQQRKLPTYPLSIHSTVRLCGTIRSRTADGWLAQSRSNCPPRKQCQPRRQNSDPPLSRMTMRKRGRRKPDGAME